MKRIYIISVELLLEMDLDNSSLSDEKFKEIAKSNVEEGAKIYDTIEEMCDDWNNDVLPDSSFSYMRVIED